MKCPKCHFQNPSGSRFCRKCATPLSSQDEVNDTQSETLRAPMTELTIGSTFAKRYIVVEELGRGGMGRVYKVFDQETMEKVALKLLNPEIAADEREIERFRNELKVARKISHKNVCRMYDLCEEEGTHYISMEYVPGEDLKRTIRRVGQLSVGKAVSIVRQICEGLVEAHRLGVVHRDLKPLNIMIDNEGNVRIMDFGIARSLVAEGMADKGVMIGTPKYMSPEQVDKIEVDQRSDIYSVGVILFEMLTGRVPFEGETPLNTALKHKTERPPNPRELNAQIPEELNRVILKCMEKDRGKRYQGVKELLFELDSIEEEITHTEKVLPKIKTLTLKEIPVQFKIKKFFIPAFVVLAIAVLGVIIGRLISPKKPVLPPSDKPSLAVMYFENNTGDKNLDHWRKGLSDLLIADLTQSKHLRVLSGERLFNILRQLNQLEAKSYSSDVLKQVADRGGVGHIIVGDYAKAGDDFRINVMLQEASSEELIGSESVKGKGEESFFSMVDELTKRIKVKFKLSDKVIAEDIDKEAGEITTSYPEAYKYYSEGRNYHLKGDNRKSIQLMEKAVSIDPEFAMAYRSMAMAFHSLGYFNEERRRLQKAFHLTDRISDRERYQIQGDFYFYQSEKTWDKAVEAYNKLLELYPDDGIGNNNLGNLYADLEQWDEAIERYEVCVQNKDESIQTYWNLAHAYMAKGSYDKAREILEYYLNNISDNAWLRGGLAYNYLCQGKYDLALVEVDKAFSLDPAINWNFWIKGDIYHCKGDLIRAKKEYMKLLDTEEETAHLSCRDRLGALYLLQGKFKKSSDQLEQGIELAEKLGEKIWAGRFHLRLAYTYLKSGNPEEALRECDKVESRVPALYFKGLIYLEMKSLNNAQRAADELKEIIQKGMKRKELRYYYNLIGMVEVERKNFSQATKHFKKASSLLHSQKYFGGHHALFISPLALAYYKAKDVEKAREEYEKIISLTGGRLYYGDIFTKSLYMLGKIYQEKGWKGKAIEYYEKFLNILEDAEPDIPEIIDASRQLDALQN